MTPGGTGAATQIYAHQFDHRFSALPIEIQRRVQAKIDEMGIRLRAFPHELAAARRGRDGFGIKRMLTSGQGALRRARPA